MLLAALATMAHTAEPVSTGWMNGAAMGGKDAVSYYSPEAKASHQVVEGSSTFTVQYLGVPWRFASKASADKAWQEILAAKRQRCKPTGLCSSFQG